MNSFNDLDLVAIHARFIKQKLFHLNHTLIDQQLHDTFSIMMDQECVMHLTLMSPSTQAFNNMVIPS